MSNLTTNNANRFRLRLTPADAQVALGLGAALLGVCAVQFENFNLLHLLLMVVFFAAGILGKRAWAICFMFATFIFLKYFLVESHLKSEFYQLRFPDFQTALILILLAAACFRYLESSRFLQIHYPKVKLGEDPKSDMQFEFPSLLGGRWWAIPLAMFLASTLLSIFPFEKPLFAQFELKPLASRLVFLTLFLFFAWFVCRAVTGIFIRWRMESPQADVHCRSLIAKELWNDVYPIERRRAKNQSHE